MITNPNHDPQEAEIDHTLAALRHAAPPEGMEARIAARITRAAAITPARSRFASLAPSSAWWRGAITGAATALLAIGLFLSSRHLTTNSMPHPVSIAETHTTSPQPTPVSLSSLDQPCPGNTITPAALPSTKPIHSDLIAHTPQDESTAPSRPAPALPLTQQERQLALLARDKDPRELAIMGRDEIAHLDTELAAELAKLIPQHSTAAPADPTPSPEVAQQPAASPTADPTPTQSTPDQPSSTQEDQQ